MSQRWDEGDGDTVSIDKELMEGGRRWQRGARKKVASGGIR